LIALTNWPNMNPTTVCESNGQGRPRSLHCPVILDSLFPWLIRSYSQCSVTVQPCTGCPVSSRMTIIQRGQIRNLIGYIAAQNSNVILTKHAIRAVLRRSRERGILSSAWPWLLSDCDCRTTSAHHECDERHELTLLFRLYSSEKSLRLLQWSYLVNVSHNAALNSRRQSIYPVRSGARGESPSIAHKPAANIGLPLLAGGAKQEFILPHLPDFRLTAAFVNGGRVAMAYSPPPVYFRERG